MGKFQITWLKMVFIISGLTFLLFMILPFPFASSPYVCTYDPQFQDSNCEQIAATSWHWLGGYHIIIERFFIPMDGVEREININEYYGVTPGGVIIYGTASLLLSVVIYVILSRAFGGEKSHNIQNTDSQNSS